MDFLCPPIPDLHDPAVGTKLVKDEVFRRIAGCAVIVVRERTVGGIADDLANDLNDFCLPGGGGEVVEELGEYPLEDSDIADARRGAQNPEQRVGDCVQQGHARVASPSKFVIL